MAQNVLVKEEIRDIYVVSIKNPRDFKKITNNYRNQPINVGDWLGSQPNSSQNQYLVYVGFYDYYHPVWGSDSLTLYFSRTRDLAQPQMTIRRVKLSAVDNTAREMMNSWLQARMNGDNEVLTYLTDNNLEPIRKAMITDLNLQKMAITDSGWQGNGLYVDVQSTLADPGQLSYKIIKEHFNVENELEGYRVKQVQVSQDIEYYGEPDGIYKLEKGKREKLLDLEGQSLSLLSFNPAVDKIIYCTREKGTYQIRSYNIANKKTEVMDSTIPAEATLEAAAYSYSGQLMSVQFNYHNKKIIYVYNLKLQQIVSVPFLYDIKRAYWFGNNMRVDSGNEVFTLHWVYNPGLGNRFL
jgi:hypothetical protein